jgi:hypothetical protein
MARTSLQLGKRFDERRSSNRWPIIREVRYRVLSGRQKTKRIGSGKTLNISGKGVLFTTESELVEGELVELAVSWPALLNGVLPLKLVAHGLVVRTDDKQAAITIERYEFKTVGSSRW